MLNERVCAKGAAVPRYSEKSEARLGDLQTDAIHLEGLLSVLVYLENEGEGVCDEGRAAIVTVAHRLAAGLSDNLDIVNLHKTEGAA